MEVQKNSRASATLLFIYFLIARFFNAYTLNLLKLYDRVVDRAMERPTQGLYYIK